METPTLEWQCEQDMCVLFATQAAIIGLCVCVFKTERAKVVYS